MVALMVVVTVVVFLIVDVTTRLALKRYQENKERQQRAEALELGLKLDYSEEAPTLKRVEVADPKAWILAVDDESIVLESFRKILVLSGFNVDTVETGREALGLIRDHEYDFVFTDLKMPEMDGLDVVKAVKHVRPDIDVIMITGYATIDTAVDAMKYGAMDYVQKPFTADELVEFANQALIRRQARIEQERRPRLHLVTPSSSASVEPRTVNVPAGLFISRTHSWVYLCRDGYLLVGVDDFALMVMGEIDEVRAPRVGQNVRKGDRLFEVISGSSSVSFVSPVSGRVATINEGIMDEPELVTREPYDRGWVCGIEPSNLPDEIRSLRIGAEAIEWYQQEVDRYVEMIDAHRSDEDGGVLSPTDVLNSSAEERQQTVADA
jgi:ActR/RegA family two-component response regulator/glycine cleavage system H lipoate-binding protein